MTGKAECGLRGFQLDREGRLELFQMCRKVTMDTEKSPRAKGVCEPPEVQGEHSAKSRLAKQENPRAGWAGWNLKAPPPPAMGRGGTGRDLRSLPTKSFWDSMEQNSPAKGQLSRPTPLDYFAFPFLSHLKIKKKIT